MADNALNFSDAGTDEFKGTRNSKYANSPFIPQVKKSYEEKVARSLDLPAGTSDEAIKGYEQEVRAVANRLGYGIKIRVRDGAKGAKRLVFQAAEKRGYTRREDADQD